jgi:hypothetical protein
MASTDPSDSFKELFCIGWQHWAVHKRTAHPMYQLAWLYHKGRKGAKLKVSKDKFALTTFISTWWLGPQQ